MLKSFGTLAIPDDGRQCFTDYARWRLHLGPGGRHTWHYLKSDAECKEWPQSEIDRYWLGLPMVWNNALHRHARHLYDALKDSTSTYFGN